jgi:hypothetical protein
VRGAGQLLAGRSASLNNIHMDSVFELHLEIKLSLSLQYVKNRKYLLKFLKISTILLSGRKAPENKELYLQLRNQ